MELALQGILENTGPSFSPGTRSESSGQWWDAGTEHCSLLPCLAIPEEGADLRVSLRLLLPCGHHRPHAQWRRLQSLSCPLDCPSHPSSPFLEILVSGCGGGGDTCKDHVCDCVHSPGRWGSGIN